MTCPTEEERVVSFVCQHPFLGTLIMLVVIGWAVLVNLPRKPKG